MRRRKTEMSSVKLGHRIEEKRNRDVVIKLGHRIEEKRNGDIVIKLGYTVELRRRETEMSSLHLH